MPIVIETDVSRRSTILAATLALHFGVFLLIASGLAPRVIETLKKEPLPVKLLPREEEPPVVVKPGVTPLVDPYHMAVIEPVLRLPDFASSDGAPTPMANGDPYAAGNATSDPLADDYAAPRLETRGLAELVDSCYPSASRRLAEEGRIVARVKIGADGRALRWHVTRSSGYSRLDEAIGCVIESLDFVAGRKDGRAAAMDADLPVIFRLQ